jgi:hypothetical protein
MNEEKKYDFSWNNNFVNLNSLSPNKKYFYQIKTPIDYYWGLFLAEISFLDINKNLIYYNSGYYASPINTNTENNLKYVSYSESGEYAYFIERKDLNNLNHILINLNDKMFKSVKWKSESGTNISNLSNDGFKNEDLKIFENSEWNYTPKNKRIERSFLFCKIWFPKI